MTPLNQATRRRLQKLPQSPSVWEGDRCPLSSGLAASLDAENITKGECILWVDGSEGMIRAMDVVPQETGQEAMVRTLLRAMETPHSFAKPARPQKIVVRNRETQFFLRGVLQDLDIKVEYEAELPLIDEFLRGFQELAQNQVPRLPPRYSSLLEDMAKTIWNDAPWDSLEEQEILAIEINRWDVETLYASVMGMLGMEYGILLYRSLESLKSFREKVLSNDSFKNLQEAFLQQDCLFLTFDRKDGDNEFGDDADEVDLNILADEDIVPTFGNIHPLEGLRPVLYEEEAIAVLVALEGIHRFLRQHRTVLDEGLFPSLTARYRIPNPEDNGSSEPVTLTLADSQPTGKAAKKGKTPAKSASNKSNPASIAITVTSLPELATELEGMLNDDEEVETLDILRDDMIPENSFLSLGMLPWDLVEAMRAKASHQAATEGMQEKGDGLPSLLIQTSLPKAKQLIQDIQNAGGITAMCFNPGENSLFGERYELGILKTGNGDLHIFGEFMESDPVHQEARKKWNQRCKKTGGFCGLVIAKGVTGNSRGNPHVRDMLCLFETQAISSAELGIGKLELRLRSE